jgi:hypothetical protein
MKRREEHGAPLSFMDQTTIRGYGGEGFGGF